MDIYVGYLALGPGFRAYRHKRVLRWIPPLTISMILILEPVIGSIIGWIVGVDSIPQRWTIIGGYDDIWISISYIWV